METLATREQKTLQAKAYPVDLLSGMDYESLGRSGEHFLAALQSGDASATQRFILPDGGEEVNISESNVSFLSLFGEEHPRHRVLALSEQDRAVLALYLCSGWWAVEEALRTSDPSRHGLVEVQSVGERLVLFILNQIVYGTQESPPDQDNPLFTPHPPREQATILWQEGEAAGFYTVKRKVEPQVACVAAAPACVTSSRSWTLCSSGGAGGGGGCAWRCWRVTAAPSMERRYWGSATPSPQPCTKSAESICWHTQSSVIACTRQSLRDTGARGRAFGYRFSWGRFLQLMNNRLQLRESY
ncbi:protein FAM169B-like isoform X5 [Acipenser ruthenus]|uniref:protein FAM169B-like isoform X5 n=1 Tax=Acipenser ruthenus TaxID=7906 RepID=UPI00145BE198|nr:protein FAM169B-like isoform X5 [Acipenser ruthenus]